MLKIILFYPFSICYNYLKITLYKERSLFIMIKSFHTFLFSSIPTYTKNKLITFKGTKQYTTLKVKIYSLSDDDDDTKKEFPHTKYLKSLSIYFSSKVLVVYFYYKYLLEYTLSYIKYAQGFPLLEDLFFSPYSTSSYIYFFPRILNVEAVKNILLFFH